MIRSVHQGPGTGSVSSNSPHAREDNVQALAQGALVSQQKLDSVTQDIKTIENRWKYGIVAALVTVVALAIIAPPIAIGLTIALVGILSIYTSKILLEDMWRDKPQCLYRRGDIFVG